MKKFTIILAITMLLALALSGCAGCDGDGGEPQGGLPFWFDVPNVRLYSADLNTMEFDYIEVHSSEVIDQMLEINGIAIDGFEVGTFVIHDGEIPPRNVMIVNLNAEAEQTSLQGSTGASLATEIILRTFASFPNIEAIEILIDGASGRYGDHFDFSDYFLIAID